MLDRQGPDVGSDRANRKGFPCTCRWSSGVHGERCPEHGELGIPVRETPNKEPMMLKIVQDKPEPQSAPKTYSISELKAGDFVVPAATVAPGGQIPHWVGISLVVHARSLIRLGTLDGDGYPPGSMKVDFDPETSRFCRLTDVELVIPNRVEMV